MLAAAPFDRMTSRALKPIAASRTLRASPRLTSVASVIFFAVGPDLTLIGDETRNDALLTGVGAAPCVPPSMEAGIPSGGCPCAIVGLKRLRTSTASSREPASRRPAPDSRRSLRVPEPSTTSCV